MMFKSIFHMKNIRKNLRRKPFFYQLIFSRSCSIYNLALQQGDMLIQECRRWEIGCWSSISQIIIKLGGLYTDVWQSFVSARPLTLLQREHGPLVNQGSVSELFEWGKFIRSFFIDKLKFKRKVNINL